MYRPHQQPTVLWRFLTVLRAVSLQFLGVALQLGRQLLSHHLPLVQVAHKVRQRCLRGAREGEQHVYLTPVFHLLNLTQQDSQR